MIGLLVLSLIAVAAVPSACTIPIVSELISPKAGCSICTVLVTVPLSSYEFYVFPTLNAKIAANSDFFSRGFRQAWVDAPNPRYCNPPPPINAVCTLLGRFEQIYKYYVFCSAQDKFRANNALLAQSQNGFYQAYVDAPFNLCR